MHLITNEVGNLKMPKVLNLTPRSEHLLACPETWRNVNQSCSPLEQTQLTHDMKT